MESVDIVERAKRSGIRLVRFLWCDNGGIIRGKSTHVGSLAQRLQNGIGITPAMQAMNMLDQLQPVEGFTAVGEVCMLPDPKTFVVLPYAPHTAAMLCDLVTLAGQPWPACQRTFLRRVVNAALDQGIRVQAAFEPEWSLARRADDGYVPADSSLCFSSIGFSTAAAVIDEVVAALESQGIDVEQYYPELGHGQQELSIRHAEPIRAADNHILYRETVRNVVATQGFLASFAPKPWRDQAGNGCHLHLSAWDLAAGTNLFFDARDAYHLSDLGYRFIGGVLHHLPALLALTCPSYNSYRRLQPGSWSGAYVCFGPHNREAAIRIVNGTRASQEATIHLELKSCDSSCNPYLALGGVIAAGLDGVARNLRPSEGQLVHVDPATLSEAERQQRGIARLPLRLNEALDALEQDEVLMNALGPELARAYLAVRRSEWRAFSQADEHFELVQHFYKY